MAYIIESGKIPGNIQSYFKEENIYGVSRGTCCMYGFFVIIVIIAIVLISVFCCRQQDTVSQFTEAFTQRLGGLYNDISRTLPEGNQHIEQPGVFRKQIDVGPGNCKPYSGCFYPSFMSNPVSLKTGMRRNEPKENEIWCEKSWRDCNAYQDCINGKCTPKGYPQA